MSETHERAVRVDFEVPAGIRPEYVSNLVVSHDKHDFTITFFDIRPPLLVGAPEEKAAKVAALDTLKARCAGQFIIAASRMPEFVQVLKDNLKTYQATHEVQQDEQGSDPSSSSNKRVVR